VRRLPAGEIEGVVMAQVRALLRQPEVIVGTWLAARASRRQRPEGGKAPDLTEAEAREARRGLWADPDLAVQDAARVAAEPLRFAVVEGRVARVGRSEAFTWLDFGEGRRRDFTVRIPTAARRSFRRAGLDPDQLAGRRLRVRGWLFESGGAMMEVEEALHVEVLE